MDPVQTAIMANRFNAIVEEASSTLQRTAHTTFVKLVQDFQCALANAEGEAFAYPVNTGVSAFIGLSVKGGLGDIPLSSLKPGDCIITNDPYSSDGMVTHMMDVSLVRPIFRDGQLIALAWAFVHASDIGGAVPGSIAPTLTETFQEGLRLRPVLLYREGVLNEAVRNILLDNSRISSELWGDIQAMLSALKSMDVRLGQLCDRYSTQEVIDGMGATLALSEARAREVIAEIPDGTYEFADYIEGMKAGEFINIYARMTVCGSDLLFDFTGTDPQVLAAFNYVTGSTTHPYTLQSLIYYILTKAPDAPRNRGLLRPVKIIAPRGTIINANFPAAGGSRVTASTRVYDVVLGCLNAAIPEGLAAAGPGMSGIIVVTGRDRLHGGKRVSVINPICGGGGGKIGHDGIDGVDNRSGSLLTVPAETIEVETVMRVRRYGLVADSQAPGRWRSGASVVLDLENTDVEAVMTVRGMDRLKFTPWGIMGGAPGSLARVIVNPGTKDERDNGKIDVLHFKRGDIVRLITPAGGGFGSPSERDAELVLSDVKRGLVSIEKARTAYGVVIREDLSLNHSETEKTRSAMKTREGRFSHCETRETLDAIWPTEVRAALAVGAFEYDGSLRAALVRNTVSRFVEDRKVATIDAIPAALAEEDRRLQQ
ncbi:hydantoinase B/oxoprolinase family protein [Rhizobium sp. SYY.PMSO]|uniref:hydantoinase B/oxoprolinase family protein n=1 Tax=Rhizobium sp. SYY.PMSO TaxID=3382192 RepID=UPI00398FE1F2